MIIAIDAMGGDNAPDSVIRAVRDIRKSGINAELRLFGPEKLLRDKLKEAGIDDDRVQVTDAPSVISLHEAPVMAVRRKTDSSIVRGLYSVKNGECDAFISAGSTGAVISGGTLIVGRAKNVPRAPLGALIPTAKGVCLLLDSGANTDSKPEWLVQYAKMGAVYMEKVIGISSPRIGLANIGAEEEKGNALVKETMPLLKEVKGINFLGSCEARDLVSGDFDIVIADAFTGNCMLKMYEGVGKMLLSEIKSAIKDNPVSMMGGILIKPSLRKTLKKFDASEHGGAPLLGLKGLVVKVHGNTDGKEIVNAVKQCMAYVESGANEELLKALEDN